MANIQKLKGYIEQSGMTMVAVSNQSGIKRETLYNRLNGIGEFTAAEITGRSKCLHLSNAERDDSFFTS